MKYREEEWKTKKEHHKIFQIWVPLSKMSPYLIKAVLIAEDDKFWKHEGFDYDSIEKAIEKDIQAGKFRFGGSTISQQLAKNLYLSPVKSIWRKIAEAILTWKLERNLSKKRILELYLNLVEWGEGIFGVEVASRHYFGKSSIDLTPLEAARLAAILPNPRRFNPTGNQGYMVRKILRTRFQEVFLAKDLKLTTTSVMTFGSGLPGISPRDNVFNERIGKHLTKVLNGFH